MYTNVTSIILAIVCFIVIACLGFISDILREPAVPVRLLGKQLDDKLKTPFSFSRFQLWIWTLIIIPIFVLYWGAIDDHIPKIDNTALILLGISAGSLTSASIIQSAKNSNANRKILKGEHESEGFFKDILSDDHRQFSIGRLQNFLFTIVYVVIYVVLFFNNSMEKFTEFDNNAFILMGISTGGYLLGKGDYK